MKELVADLDRIVQFDAAGIPLLARRVDGLHRPDFSRVSMPGGAPMANLADELEPPARFEVSVRDSGNRGERVRTVGLTALLLVVIAGGTIAAVAFLRARDRVREPVAAASASGPASAAPARSIELASASAPSSTAPSASSVPPPSASSSAPASVTPPASASATAYAASSAAVAPVATAPTIPASRPPTPPASKPTSAPTVKATAKPTGDIENPFQ
jgi:cytoskeletal protein RodZ